MNVLLLEDELELLELAKGQLHRAGYEVFSAQNLAEAREYLKDESQTIDVLVADHDVPDGYGARFAIEVKGLLPEAKVVVISGRLGMENIEELEAHGIAYFNKPLLYAEIVDELIEKHL